MAAILLSLEYVTSLDAANETIGKILADSKSSMEKLVTGPDEQYNWNVNQEEPQQDRENNFHLGPLALQHSWERESRPGGQ